jgi:hypothetical protein
MKRIDYNTKIFIFIILILIGSILSSCAGNQAKYIRENPNFLKPYLRAQAFIDAWGQPDEVMAYQDFRDKQYSHAGFISGSSQGFSGFSSGQSYTPTTVVWIYRSHKKVLFFQKKTLLHTNPNPWDIQTWQLVGWENLINEPTTKPQLTPPDKSTTSAPTTSSTVVTVTWTSTNIRSGAGNEFPVVTTVKQGDRLTVIGEHGEWFNVRLEDGKDGWINSGVVKQK